MIASFVALPPQFNVHGYQGTSGNRSGLYQEVVVQGGKVRGRESARNR